MSRDISKTIIVIPHVRGLITPLITIHEPAGQELRASGFRGLDVGGLGMKAP